MKHKIHLVSFVGGYKNSAEIETRFIKDACTSGLFDTVDIVSERENKCLFEQYMEEFSSITPATSRGFGYWTWKPYILLDFMERYEEPSIICYADIGCEFSRYGRLLHKIFCYITERQQLCVFSTSLFQSEICWTKKEVFRAIKIDKRKLLSDQIQATYFYLLNNKRNLEMVKRWLDLCKSEKHSLVNDSQEVLQSEWFIEHRHDQSLFSMLCKARGIMPFWSNCYFNEWQSLHRLVYPVHCQRNKSGVSSENTNDPKSIARWVKTSSILLTTTTIVLVIKDFLYSRVKGLLRRRFR